MISKAIDTYAALRFLRILTMKWEDIKAYKLGIIDKDGNALKKPRDIPTTEKKYYTLFHRLVFNLKRLLQKTPIVGKSILTNYATALYMLREEIGLESDAELLEALEEHLPLLADLKTHLDESVEHPALSTETIIHANKTLLCNETLEPIIREGSEIKIIEQVSQFGDIPIYLGKHVATGLSVFVSPYDAQGLNEEGVAAVTTSSVGSVSEPVRFKPVQSRKFRVFDITDDVFMRFIDPKQKHKRWSNYISNEDEQYQTIRKCVKRGDMVFLRDSKGRVCTVRNYKK